MSGDARAGRLAALVRRGWRHVASSADADVQPRGRFAHAMIHTPCAYAVPPRRFTDMTPLCSRRRGSNVDVGHRPRRRGAHAAPRTSMGRRRSVDTPCSIIRFFSCAGCHFFEQARPDGRRAHCRVAGADAAGRAAQAAAMSGQHFTLAARAMTRRHDWRERHDGHFRPPTPPRRAVDNFRGRSFARHTMEFARKLRSSLAMHTFYYISRQ